MNDWAWLMEKPSGVKKKDLNAYCGSLTCSRDKSLVIKKNIIGRPMFCPDCGNALVWKYDTTERISTAW
jgi:hypothetical protein